MNLDQDQIKAVEADSQNILCIAGPGSGKTRTLVERAAHLIEKRKVSPYELALFTFTRYAAQEMKERITERIGPQANHITIGTFHGVALRRLRQFGDLIGYMPKNVTVYGEFEEQYLLKECAIDLGIYKKSWKPAKKDILKVFHEYYYRGEEPNGDDPCATIFQDFMARCRENQSLTYGGLLVSLKLLLPHIGKNLQWKHIMVDEAHDNNLIQWLLIREIQKICGASLFTVADLDQSIYKWRGAFPEWILKHQEEFDIYRLESNYRSLHEIVEASNRLIQHNTQRIEKTMRTTRFHSDLQPLIIEEGVDSYRLARYIKGYKKAYPDQKIAVLARIHALLDKLSVELNISGVPHARIGRKTVLVNSEEFRRFHAFLKLLVNPFDNMSFLLIRDIVGLSRSEYTKIRLQATQESKSHFQVWIEKDPEELESWQGLFKSAPSYDLEDFTTILLNKLDGGKLEPGFFSEAEFVLDWCAPHMKDTSCIEGPLQQYLEYLATWDIQNELGEEETAAVQLMTVHAAKGLEFPIVIIAGCNEGILPSKQSINADDMEEERRLFYVAMTRAEDRLILTIRPTDTERGSSPKSRFVGEALYFR